MIIGSLKQRIAAARNLNRAMFYVRLLIIFAILVTIGFWLDYWIRGELGMAKKFMMFAQGEWGRGVLIAGGIIYSLLLSLPFVPGVELAIAILVNLPGNYILGGGGGIAIACGTRRRISWKGFLVTIILAVSPVPLLVYLGIVQLEAFFGL